MSEEYLLKEECYAIIGACFEVYNQMGAGFLEAVYQECLEKELAARGIKFIRHPELRLWYKEHALEQTYIPDLICLESVMLELKAVSGLADEHRAQLHNYLKASKLRLGLLVNFGHHPGLEFERIIR